MPTDCEHAMYKLFGCIPTFLSTENTGLHFPRMGLLAVQHPWITNVFLLDNFLFRNTTLPDGTRDRELQ